MAKKKLTQFEEDCIWMSYRYCIGRHTITSNMHAGHIAQNCYDRLSNERLEFMANDIRDSINFKLGDSIEDYLKKNSNTSTSISDFLAWNDLASLFDKKNHKIIVVKNKETGEISEVECFSSWRILSYKTNEYTRIWRPVKEYLANPLIMLFIPDENIIDIKDCE